MLWKSGVNEPRETFRKMVDPSSRDSMIADDVFKQFFNLAMTQITMMDSLTSSI